MLEGPKISREKSWTSEASGQFCGVQNNFVFQDLFSMTFEKLAASCGTFPLDESFTRSIIEKPQVRYSVNVQSLMDGDWVPRKV